MNKGYSTFRNSATLCFVHEVAHVNPWDVQIELDKFARIVDIELHNIKQWLNIEYANRDPKFHSEFNGAKLAMRFTTTRAKFADKQAAMDFCLQLRAYGFYLPDEIRYLSPRSIVMDFTSPRRPATLAREVQAVQTVPAVQIVTPAQRTERETLALEWSPN